MAVPLSCVSVCVCALCCRYRYLGKIVALATHSSTTAKFDAVIERLTGIMPLGRAPSFTCRPAQLSQQQNQHAQMVPALSVQRESGASAAGGSSARTSSTAMPDSGGSVRGSGAGSGPAPVVPAAAAAASSCDSPIAAAGTSAGALVGLLKGSRSSGEGASLQHGDPPAGPVSVSAAAAALPADKGVLAVQLRSNEAEKVSCICYGLPPSELLSLSSSSGGHSPLAAPCVWWSVGERLEFYSECTQSTTSFAPRGEHAAITCVALDHAGNVWAGNTRGSVMMRRQRNWDQVGCAT